MRVLPLIALVACDDDRDVRSPTTAGVAADEDDDDDVVQPPDDSTASDAHLTDFGCGLYVESGGGASGQPMVTDPEQFWYEANVYASDADGTLVLDCAACELPRLEVHSFPHFSRPDDWDFRVPLHRGYYVPGEATAIDCLKDPEYDDESWTVGIRTTVEGADLCMLVVHVADAYGDEFREPDVGCVAWPYADVAP